MTPLPVLDLSPMIEQIQHARESVGRLTMLEFQHGNVGNDRFSAAQAEQKIAANPLTNKA
ncbi:MULTISPECIES: hypothetical protein [unclassified Sphingomonas]|uniref:hypothetical protein n=1 Tax=unclassified Sphingomonas TaxID=196159 RepID=UPI0006F5AC0E|nr:MULTISPECIES: hypothetical protein [unclassified Sphingomonas]KQX19378.1 hypothetical protein ASD17_12615 [Sphingomonas sp. Root1294]KQY65581.1 hypothetical protein ASD39_15815 [Sphingomonas sp. Root50]KRB95118.1 hypothetical protein ASE22_04240 [Sphingomonas sp. Root720]